MEMGASAGRLETMQRVNDGSTVRNYSTAVNNTVPITMTLNNAYAYIPQYNTDDGITRYLYQNLNNNICVLTSFRTPDVQTRRVVADVKMYVADTTNMQWPGLSYTVRLNNSTDIPNCLFIPRLLSSGRITVRALDNTIMFSAYGYEVWSSNTFKYHLMTRYPQYSSQIQYTQIYNETVPKSEEVSNQMDLYRFVVGGLSSNTTYQICYEPFWHVTYALTRNASEPSMTLTTQLGFHMYVDYASY